LELLALGLAIMSAITPWQNPMKQPGAKESSMVDIDKDTRAWMRSMYAARSALARGEGQRTADKFIPRFFTKAAPAAHSSEEASGLDELRTRVRQQARARFLQRQEDELMDFDDLTALEEAMKEHDPPGPNNSSGKGLDYAEFVLVGEAAPRKATKYFEKRTFLKLQPNQHGRVDSSLLFKYIYNSICLQKTRITLHYYDSEMEGYLREQVSTELHLYICKTMIIKACTF
jgi:hypothetical protein